MEGEHLSKHETLAAACTLNSSARRRAAAPSLTYVV